MIKLLLTEVPATPSNFLDGISTVGFPIVMCLVFFIYMQKRIDKLTEALTNNTIVIEKLLERMDK